MASQMASQVLDKGWELPDRVTDFNKVSASSSFLSIIALRENDHDEEAGDRMGYPDYPKFTCRQCRAIVFRVPEPASAHSRNRLSSTPHPATEIHRSSERVPLPVVLEILVARLQRPKIPLVFIHLINVFAHQYAVLILHEKIACRIRLPAQFSQHRRNVHIHVRIRVEQSPQPLQIISMKCQMRRNEVRPRMF